MTSTPSESKLTTDLADLFYRGNYSDLLGRTLDRAHPIITHDQITWIVASLAFTGRCTEAEALYNSHLETMSQSQAVACTFFLALGLMRLSSYTAARRYLALNLRRMRSTNDPRDHFFIYQGLGVYRYYCGRCSQALLSAEKSFLKAVEANYLYGRLLSSDLRGHLSIRTGDIFAGLFMLKQAADLAQKAGWDNTANAIGVAQVIYRAIYGASEDPVKELQDSLAGANSLQNNYTRANLMLELARQYMLRGLFSEAKATLDETAQLVYGYANRRQEATLAARLGYLAYLQGDAAMALNLVQTGQKHLDHQVDHTLKQAIQGFEYKLVQTLQVDACVIKLRNDLITSTRFFADGINKRIMARNFDMPDLKPAISNDKIADIADVVAQVRNSEQPTRDQLEAILNSGYLAFLLDIFPHVRGGDYICADLQQGYLTTFHRNGVEHRPGLSPLLKALLSKIAESETSKEDLIKSVWGYENYRPLQHNQLVFQAIKGLRKIMGSSAYWVMTTEGGYYLKPDVRILKATLVDSQKHRTAEENFYPAEAQFDGFLQLNHRQRLFLSRFSAGDSVNVSEYKDLVGTTEITAGRDLAQLTEKGLIQRTGKARATRYIVKKTST